MSLHPQAFCPIPEETARAAYPKGNVYIQVRDNLGMIYDDQAFAYLFPNRGQPAEAPWRLALVTVLQFAEGLSDRQAADAVRGRLDWKYLLSLELTDPGFDASVLCEFRTRLLEGNAEQQILQPLLDLAAKQGWRYSLVGSSVAIRLMFWELFGPSIAWRPLVKRCEPHSTCWQQ